MHKIINLTPHSVTVRVTATEAALSGQGVNPGNTTYPSSGTCRLGEVDSAPVVDLCDAEGIQGGYGSFLVERSFRLDSLPAPEDYTWYIVSLPVLMALAAAGVHRPDLVAPDTGRDCYRDAKGNIEAVRRFVRLASDGRKVHVGLLVEAGIRAAQRVLGYDDPTASTTESAGSLIRPAAEYGAQAALEAFGLPPIPTSQLTGRAPAAGAAVVDRHLARVACAIAVRTGNDDFEWCLAEASRQADAALGVEVAGA